MDQNKLKSVLESLLFVSGEPVKISKLSKIVEVKPDEAKSALEQISKEYLEGGRGLSVLFKKDEVQLVSSNENSAFVEKMVKNELEGPLSSAAMEVLSIVAYRGPISKPEIESIRGVNCSYTLRNLSIRGLVERENNPKDARGYVYSVSFDFLKKLGIEKVENLPEYDRLSVDERVSSIIQEQ